MILCCEFIFRYKNSILLLSSYIFLALPTKMTDINTLQDLKNFIAMSGEVFSKKVEQFHKAYNEFIGKNFSKESAMFNEDDFSEVYQKFSERLVKYSTSFTRYIEFIENTSMDDMESIEKLASQYCMEIEKNFFNFKLYLLQSPSNIQFKPEWLEVGTWADENLLKLGNKVLTTIINTEGEISKNILKMTTEEKENSIGYAENGILLARMSYLSGKVEIFKSNPTTSDRGSEMETWVNEECKPIIEFLQKNGYSRTLMEEFTKVEDNFCNKFAQKHELDKS